MLEEITAGCVGRRAGNVRPGLAVEEIDNDPAQAKLARDRSLQAVIIQIVPDIITKTSQRPCEHLLVLGDVGTHAYHGIGERGVVDDRRVGEQVIGVDGAIETGGAGEDRYAAHVQRGQRPRYYPSVGGNRPPGGGTDGGQPIGQHVGDEEAVGDRVAVVRHGERVDRRLRIIRYTPLFGDMDVRLSNGVTDLVARRYHARRRMRHRGRVGDEVSGIRIGIGRGPLVRDAGRNGDESLRVVRDGGEGSRQRLPAPARRRARTARRRDALDAQTAIDRVRNDHIVHRRPDRSTRHDEGIGYQRAECRRRRRREVHHLGDASVNRAQCGGMAAAAVAPRDRRRLRMARPGIVGQLHPAGKEDVRRDARRYPQHDGHHQRTRIAAWGEAEPIDVPHQFILVARCRLGGYDGGSVIAGDGGGHEAQAVGDGVGYDQIVGRHTGLRVGPAAGNGDGEGVGYQIIGTDDAAHLIHARYQRIVEGHIRHLIGVETDSTARIEIGIVGFQHQFAVDEGLQVIAHGPHLDVIPFARHVGHIEALGQHGIGRAIALLEPHPWRIVAPLEAIPVVIIYVAEVEAEIAFPILRHTHHRAEAIVAPTALSSQCSNKARRILEEHGGLRRGGGIADDRPGGGRQERPAVGHAIIEVLVEQGGIAPRRGYVALADVQQRGHDPHLRRVGVEIGLAVIHVAHLQVINLLRAAVVALHIADHGGQHTTDAHRAGEIAQRPDDVPRSQVGRSGTGCRVRRRRAAAVAVAVDGHRERRGNITQPVRQGVGEHGRGVEVVVVGEGDIEGEDGQTADRPRLHLRILLEAGQQRGVGHIINLIVGTAAIAAGRCRYDIGIVPRRAVDGAHLRRPRPACRNGSRMPDYRVAAHRRHGPIRAVGRLQSTVRVARHVGNDDVVGGSRSRVGNPNRPGYALTDIGRLRVRQFGDDEIGADDVERRRRCRDIRPGQTAVRHIVIVLHNGDIRPAGQRTGARRCIVAGAEGDRRPAGGEHHPGIDHRLPQIGRPRRRRAHIDRLAVHVSGGQRVGEDHAVSRWAGVLQRYGDQPAATVEGESRHIRRNEWIAEDGARAQHDRIALHEVAAAVRAAPRPLHLVLHIEFGTAVRLDDARADRQHAAGSGGQRPKGPRDQLPGLHVARRRIDEGYIGGQRIGHDDDTRRSRIARVGRRDRPVDILSRLTVDDLRQRRRAVDVHPRLDDGEIGLTHGQDEVRSIGQIDASADIAVTGVDDQLPALERTGGHDVETNVDDARRRDA